MHRFVGPLKTYERTFRGYSVLDNFLNLTSILAGLGASLAAALECAQGVARSSLGLVVGGATEPEPVAQAVQRSTRRGLAATAMRTEGWAFLQGRDRYKGKDPGLAWALFCDQIDRVEDREQAEQDKEAARTATTEAQRRVQHLSPATRHHMPDATRASIRRGPSSAGIASRSASVSCSRLDNVLRRHPVGPRHRGRVEARKLEPGAPATCSNSANHLRIMYSALRTTRNVTGTL